jgi:flavorubredoxin
MPNTVLYDAAGHRNILLEDFGHGLAVQANQHVIIDGKEGMILDPGGHKVYNKALSETASLLRGNELKYIFLSHQDPDIVAATNGWLMTTDAEAWISKLWVRFVPHFGIDKFVEHRLKGIPDEGGYLRLGATELVILPAHFLHSCGNFHIYDPTSRILYSGDLGASLGMPEVEVKDFKSHLQYMEGFHRRYMMSNKALKAWVQMVRPLDIQMIAPQHGAFFRGKELCGQFLDWLEDLPCGLDVMENVYRIPSR